jgi:predicted nucleic acid-binding Zn ribbon protein
MPHSKDFARRKDRRSTDPVAIGDIVQGLLAEQVFSRGMPVARLAATWAEVVGERLAAETAPASLEGGVLTVQATNGPWGAQAKFLVEQIKDRANEALGADEVRSVRVTIRPRS